MSDPYTGEIRMFAGNYAPRGWAFCHGQLMQVAQNPQLFALLGMIYGGDGRTTFGIPDLRGRVAINQGHGPGLRNYALGYKLGSREVILRTENIPKHNHSLRFSTTSNQAVTEPEGNMLCNTEFNLYNNDTTPNDLVDMWDESIDSYGEASPQSHYNMQPYLCLSFIICTDGIWPERP